MISGLGLCTYLVIHRVPAIPHRRPPMSARTRSGRSTRQTPRPCSSRSEPFSSFGVPGSRLHRLAGREYRQVCRTEEVRPHGSRHSGARRLGGLVMGSVVTKVLSLCATPVLLVRWRALGWARPGRLRC